MFWFVCLFCLFSFLTFDGFGSHSILFMLSFRFCAFLTSSYLFLQRSILWARLLRATERLNPTHALVGDRQLGQFASRRFSEQKRYRPAMQSRSGETIILFLGLSSLFFSVFFSFFFFVVVVLLLCPSSSSPSSLLLLFFFFSFY